jgi:hypothetical protein
MKLYEPDDAGYDASVMAASCADCKHSIEVDCAKDVMVLHKGNRWDVWRETHEKWLCQFDGIPVLYGGLPKDYGGDDCPCCEDGSKLDCFEWSD